MFYKNTTKAPIFFWTKKKEKKEKKKKEKKTCVPGYYTTLASDQTSSGNDDDEDKDELSNPNLEAVELQPQVPKSDSNEEKYAQKNDTNADGMPGADRVFGVGKESDHHVAGEDDEDKLSPLRKPLQETSRPRSQWPI